MKKYRLISIEKFLLIIAVIIIPVVATQVNLKSSLAEIPSTQIEKIEIVEVSTPIIKKETPSRKKIEQKEDYLSYITKFEITPQRAQFLLDSIKQTNTNIPTSLILSMIENETKFKNIKSEIKSEDSAGYIQMKSDTIKWLKTIYPSLPTVKSQNDFINSPSTQIQYMVKYLEYANEKFNYDYVSVVSSYNMGLNNKRINEYYVNQVTTNKEVIERFVYKI